MDIVYYMFPVRGGVVIDGPASAAGYSAVSQDEARADVLHATPSATGTARAWAGDADEIVTGSVTGQDLDAEVAR